MKKSLQGKWTSLQGAGTRSKLSGKTLKQGQWARIYEKERAPNRFLIAVLGGSRPAK